MFHVGQKVVCVDGRAYWWSGPAPPTEGATYTIAGVFPDRDAHGEYGVTLVEIEAFRGPLSRPGFAASRFRPLVETDISIFHEIARKATKRKPVNASKSFEDTSWHS